MNLSMFESDGTLGSLAGTYKVHLRVAGYNFASVIYGESNFRQVIGRRLAENQIGIALIRNIRSNAVTGYYEYLIVVDALVQHDIETVKRLIRNSLIGDLSNLTIDVDRVESAPAGAAGSGSGFLDKLGFGLGISTPIVIAAAAGVAIVVLKR